MAGLIWLWQSAPQPSAEARPGHGGRKLEVVKRTPLTKRRQMMRALLLAAR